jgi:hypothetical protein
LKTKGARDFTQHKRREKARAQKNARDDLRKLLANQIRRKKSSESQTTTPIQPTSNTSKDEETKMAKKVKKASKKPAAKKTAKKVVRKVVRKARKTAKKTAKKVVRKARKTVRKAAKRRPARKMKKAPVAASM